MEVKVYYYGTTTEVTGYGPYTVTLSLSPSGSLSGTLTGTTSSGIVTFSNLYILSRNTYTLVATATGLLSGSSTSFFTTNYVKTMTISMDHTSPSTLFNHIITVNLYGDDGAYYTGTVAVTISSLTLTGTLTKSTSSGISAFSQVYFASYGSETVTASVPASSPFSSVSTTLPLTVHQDRLKITGTMVKNK